MLIRYLKDGVDEISGDVQVLAKGFLDFFIEGNKPHTLKAIPFHTVVAKIYYQNEEPPYVVDYIKDNSIEGVDFSLTDVMVH